MIVVEDLVVKLGDFTLEIPRLEVRDREYLVVMGPSGVGKTVFLLTLAGFFTPMRGRILVNGRNITRYPPEKRGFTLIPQDYGLFPHMTVYENIAFGLEVRGFNKKDVRDRVEWIAEVLEIKNILGKKPRELSGGEQQRVALARALVVKPEIILLDEPFSNLDPRRRAGAREFIKELRKKLGFTAIHVTHDLVDAVELGDRIAYMEAGRLLGVYGVEEFLKSPYARPYIDNVKALVKFLR